MNDADSIHIDSRSHLEVADKRHRYSKNLRYYFKEYSRVFGCQTITDPVDSSFKKWSRYDPFFAWLDNSSPKPDLDECPRSVLDSDVVEYLTSDEERSVYEIEIGADSRFRRKLTDELVCTGPKGWIFVLKHERLFAREKRTSTFPRFQHSSFFAGGAVHAAGMFVCVEGVLTTLFPHSGHYRPLERHLCYLLLFLEQRGLPLKNIQVDAQRVLRCSRQKDAAGGGKVRKTECAVLHDGGFVLDLLRTNQTKQESGLLAQLKGPVVLRRRLEDGENALVDNDRNVARMLFCGADAQQTVGDVSIARQFQGAAPGDINQHFKRATGSDSQPSSLVGSPTASRSAFLHPEQWDSSGSHGSATQQRAQILSSCLLYAQQSGRHDNPATPLQLGSVSRDVSLLLAESPGALDAGTSYSGYHNGTIGSSNCSGANSKSLLQFRSRSRSHSGACSRPPSRPRSPTLSPAAADGAFSEKAITSHGGIAATQSSPLRLPPSSPSVVPTA